jgi:hypothetical protein
MHKRGRQHTTPCRKSAGSARASPSGLAGCTHTDSLVLLNELQLLLRHGKSRRAARESQGAADYAAAQRGGKR